MRRSSLECQQNTLTLPAVVTTSAQSAPHRYRSACFGKPEVDTPSYVVLKSLHSHHKLWLCFSLPQRAQRQSEEGGRPAKQFLRDRAAEEVPSDRGESDRSKHDSATFTDGVVGLGQDSGPLQQACLFLDAFAVGAHGLFREKKWSFPFKNDCQPETDAFPVVHQAGFARLMPDLWKGLVLQKFMSNLVCRKTTASAGAPKKAGGAGAAGMWRFYTEDSPGIKV